MKNTRVETLINKSKLFSAKPRHSTCKNGVKIFHCYEEDKDKSFWDDFSIRNGSHWLFIAWQHPRYVYENLCSSLAYDLVDAEWPQQQFEMKTKKLYKKVGKSRKKVRCYEYVVDDQDIRRSYYEAVDLKTRELLRTSDFEVKVSFKVNQFSHSKGIEFVFPTEILCEDDVIEVAHLAKQIYNDRSILADRFKTYTRHDWIKENENQ